MPPCCSAGGIFSVALSVTAPHRVELSSTPHAEACNSALRRSLRGRPLALPGALPSCPEAAVRQLRGYPKAQAPRSSSPALASLRRRCPDFPPAPIARGQRSPGPSANFIIARFLPLPRPASSTQMCANEQIKRKLGYRKSVIKSSHGEAKCQICCG